MIDSIVSLYKNAYTKLILAITSFAGVYQVAHYLVAYMEPITLGFTRYFIASIILLIALKKYRGHIFNKAQFKSNWLLLISIGLFGIGLYNLAFLASEKYISGSMVAIIFSFSPCLTAFLGSLIFKQRVTIIGYLGMFIALVGTIGVINYASPTCGKFYCFNIFSHISKGEFYAIILCILAAVFSILNKKASIQKIDSLTITTYAAVFGALTLFIFVMMFGDFSNFWHKPYKFWFAMFYISVIGSVLAYFWYSEAIAQLGISKVAVFLNGVPFTTVLIGFILLNQPISFSEIGCGLIIIIGVIITNYAVNRRR